MSTCSFGTARPWERRHLADQLSIGDILYIHHTSSCLRRTALSDSHVRRPTKILEYAQLPYHECPHTIVKVHMAGLTRTARTGGSNTRACCVLFPPVMLTPCVVRCLVYGSYLIATRDVSHLRECDACTSYEVRNARRPHKQSSTCAPTCVQYLYRNNRETAYLRFFSEERIPMCYRRCSRGCRVVSPAPGGQHGFGRFRSRYAILARAEVITSDRCFVLHVRCIFPTPAINTLDAVLYPSGFPWACHVPCCWSHFTSSQSFRILGKVPWQTSIFGLSSLVALYLPVPPSLRPARLSSPGHSSHRLTAFPTTNGCLPLACIGVPLSLFSVSPPSPCLPSLLLITHSLPHFLPSHPLPPN